MCRTSGVILLFSDGIPTSGISAKGNFACSGNLKHLVNHEIAISAIQLNITESYFASYGSPYDTKRRHFGRYGSPYGIKGRRFGRYGSLDGTKRRLLASCGSPDGIKRRLLASNGSRDGIKRHLLASYGSRDDIKRLLMNFIQKVISYHSFILENNQSLIFAKHLLSDIN